MYKLTNSSSIIRLADNAGIPVDTQNTDYANYLQWCTGGNTPEPADIPNPKLAVQAEITALETAQLLPRVIREFMLLTMEAQFTPEQLSQQAGYVKLKSFDEALKALRVKL